MNMQIKEILSQNRGKIDRANLPKLYKIAWDTCRQKVHIEDINWENQEVQVTLEESYSSETYTEIYSKILVSNIVEYLKENNINIADIGTLEDLKLKIEENGDDWYDLENNARPEFISTYELLRFYAENYSDIDPEDFLNNGGDLIDNLRYECSRLVADNLDDADLLEKIRANIQGQK